MNIAIILIGALFGGIIFYIARTRKIHDVKNKIKLINKKIEISKKEAAEILNNYKVQAESIKKQTNEEAHEFESISKLKEEKINFKEDIFKRKEKKNEESISQLKNIKEEIASIKSNIDKLTEDYSERLSGKLNMTKDQILESIKNNFASLFDDIKTSKIQKIVSDMEENGPKEAKNILTYILQRYTLGSSVDRKDMSVSLPNERIKGMIIGKEGKNIQYFEEKLDVDLLFNHDGPDLIRVSSHDLLKKAIAKGTIELLIKEGKINPEIIDSCYIKAKQKIDGIIKVMGKKASEMVKLKNVPERIENLFGRFEYRSSYGQNILMHSVEVCVFASMLADEIGADYDICRIGGMTHDLGKAVDLQITTDTGYHKEIAAELLDEGVAEKLNGNMGHDDISKVIMESWDYPLDPVLREKSIYAAYCHHEKVPYKNPEDYLVKAGDAISAGRPGARQETFEFYLTRIKELEDLGRSVPEVKKAFSVSAGRELRLILNENQVEDEKMQVIADNVAQTIQETLSYPGKIKVNVIKVTEYKEKTMENTMLAQ